MGGGTDKLLAKRRAECRQGLSALQLSRDLNVLQCRTAFVLAHKLREAMASEHEGKVVLAGHVEIDGAYFGGHVKPASRKADRIDWRLAEHQTDKRRCVVAMLDRGGRDAALCGNH